MIAAVILGIAAFGFLVFFELCKCRSVRNGKEKKNPWFIVGLALLATAWFVSVILAERSPKPLMYAGLVATVLSVRVYIKLLGTTSQENTYTENRLKIPVIKTGAYAAVRHPGIWCFCLVALCITLIAPSAWPVNLLFAALNLIYCILQDRYFFPVYIEGYDEYKKETPFCIPRKKE